MKKIENIKEAVEDYFNGKLKELVIKDGVVVKKIKPTANDILLKELLNKKIK